MHQVDKLERKHTIIVRNETFQDVKTVSSLMTP